MAYGDIMDRLNDTRPTKDSNYNPFIPEGNHDLVICSIEPYQNQEQNFCVRATFVAEASDNPQVTPGKLFDAVWNLDKPSPFPGGERDKDRFATFLNKLQGVETTSTSHVELARACLKYSQNYQPGKDLFPGRDARGQLEVQPCRGARIKAHGRVKMPGPKSKAPGAKPYTMVSYTHVPQAPESVAAMRGMLDQRMPYSPRPQQAAAPVVAPAPAAAAPAPTNAWSGFFPPK